MAEAVALRVQRLLLADQVLALGELAARHLGRRFAPRDVEDLFDTLGLPAPAHVSNALASLERQGLVSRIKGRGPVWTLSPEGRHRLSDALSELDLLSLQAEILSAGGSDLGNTPHPVVPVALAPPGIIRPVLRFLEDHPFDTNIFAMTRFPTEPDSDRLNEAIAKARLHRSRALAPSRLRPRHRR